MSTALNRPAGRLDTASALSPFRGAWDERRAAHLLRRAGFGTTADELARYISMGLNRAVDSLVRFPDTSALPAADNVYHPTSVLQNFGGLRGIARDDTMRREFAKEVRRGERQSILSLQLWWLNRMLATPAPLQEKMALYFHGHFTTAAIQKGVSPRMVLAQNQLFRDNALGNVRELTWNVSVDPAMLLYLDNAKNEKAHPNENYARELMELFTLGLNHYTEQDIRESARAWSGWTVNRLSGQARFIAARHDDGQKTFLGRSGNFSGRDIVDTIFSQAQSAQWFASSLLNFFVYNDPEPELVDAFAAVIRKNDFNLAPAMSVLLRSNVFHSERAYRALVKSPVEFVVGTYKALGLPKIDASALRSLNQMGQILFYPPNVAGWPGGQNWITTQTAIARENFLAGLVNSPVMNDAAWMRDVPIQAGKAAKVLVGRLLHGDASPAGIARLTDYLNGTNTSALGMLSGENYDERVRGATYLAMAMPANQLN